LHEYDCTTFHTLTGNIQTRGGKKVIGISRGKKDMEYGSKSEKPEEKSDSPYNKRKGKGRKFCGNKK